MSNSQAAEPAAEEELSLTQVVGKLAHAIDTQLGTGQVAELRRVSPDEPYSPTLWKLLLSSVPKRFTSGAEQEKKEARWGALLMGMAITAGLHDPHVPLGKALALAGWSELRFVRLMRDQEESLVERVRRLAHYLNSKSQAANWTDVARLLLNQEGEWAERHRVDISRSYYSTLYQQKQSENE
ncbi:MAG: type I-E CRISPR-associated protein Cse2/CasB [Planctomycetes bacterium]|nr:type I-E CRISPR-associated protein Cse2/CasB [Planctomycetota bacterium]